MQRRDDNAFELLEALETQTPEPLRKLRESERVAIQAFTRLEGSDPTNPLVYEHAAVGDVSRMGCRILLPAPLQVGAVYKLTMDIDTIEADTLDATTIFARCVRCRLINEDAYEMGMRFFAPVDLDEEKQDESI